MNYKMVYIGVNFHTPNEAMMWIESIKPENQLIIIVDNTENKDFRLKHLIENYEKTNLIYLDTKANLGYLNAANYGYQYLVWKKVDFEWIVVSNVDVELVSHNCFDVLDEYNYAGIIAPGIISKDSDIDKNPYRMRRGSKRNMLIKKIAFSNVLFYSIFNGVSVLRNKIMYKKLDGQKKCEDGTHIYLPYGACMYINKLFFEKGGTIEFPLFLFGEELYLAEQCRSLNLPIVYASKIRYLNYEHASTSKLKSKYVVECDYKAISYILDKYY